VHGVILTQNGGIEELEGQEGLGGLEKSMTRRRSSEREWYTLVDE